MNPFEQPKTAARDEHLRAALLLLVLVLLGLLLACIPSEDISFDSEEASLLESGWTYLAEDGTRQTVDLPASLDVPVGEPAVLETTLPEDLDTRNSICLRAGMQSVRAYLDGELIYQFGPQDTASQEAQVGSAWVIFRLPQNSGGKTLRLELISPFASFSGSVSAVYCASKAAILFSIFRAHLGSLLVALALGVIGVCLLVLFVVAAVLGTRSPSLLYLALFSIVVGFWIFGESKTAQFFLGSAYVVEKLPYYALLLMPLPITLYLDQAYQRHTPDYPKLFFWLFTLNLLVSVGVEHTGAASFFRILPLTHVLLAALIVVTIAALTYETLRCHNRDARVQLVGLGILGISGALEIFNMWVSGFGRISQFLRIGVLLYVGYIGVATFRRLLLLARESREAEYFHRLAFTDVVTSGNNRMAFERDAEKAFSPGAGRRNWLLLFDLDHLKVINDTIGHQTGDDAIRRASQCLTAAFSGQGTCYRIGGDEFACILWDASQETVEACLRELDAQITRTRQEVPYEFGISRGCGRFAPERGDFRTFFVTVDQKLYANKQARRSAPAVT